MTRFYQHRINTLADLERVPADRGLEFDLRSDGDAVIVTHDPFTPGLVVEDFLPHVGARPLIVNVKCEGIVDRTLAALEANGISDFWFLDLPMADQVRLSRSGRRDFAVAYSELEPAALATVWRGKASWIWVDCWSAFPQDADEWALLGEHFKICLASPELHGHGADAIEPMRATLGDRRFDAVCTKRPDLWGAVS